MNRHRPHSRLKGFTLIEIVLAVTLLVALLAVGSWGYLRTMRIAEDKAAREAITAIYAAKADYLSAHPGFDQRVAPTESQLLPYVTKGGRLAPQSRAYGDEKASAEDDKVRNRYSTLDGLLPSRYRVQAIGGWNEYPTLSPMPPDPVGTLATLTPVNGGGVILTDPIDSPGIELPAGSPVKGGGPSTDPVDVPVELPVATPGDGKGDNDNN